MAFRTIAATSGRGRGGRRPLCPAALRTAIVAGLVCAIWASPASAVSNNVRITGLTDLAFGSISSFSSDSILSEDVCVYSGTTLNNYGITATGTGGGSFALAYGGNSLAYEVQWSPSPGQTSGTSLTPGMALTGQHSNASQQTCNAGPSSSASLIVIIRASAVAASTAGGPYTGTLNLLVTPE